ncbi:MAG: Bacterial membrane flanked domain protein [bacterium ADurb.Bin236]|nr:MAG: Bacterial membrane flanked domain protein [bacterium ADurb.Bin236]
MDKRNALESAAEDIATAARAIDIQRKVSRRGGRDSFSILDCPVAAGAVADPKRLERAVNRALRVGAVFGLLNSCLSRSVVLCRLLRENGVDARVAFGLNKDDDRLAGHCWVVWEGNPLWRYYFWQTFFGVVLTPVFGIGLLLLLGVWIRRITYKYQVTGSHIIARIGIFSVNTIQIAVKDIRSIEIRASFFHRLLGVREILISTAGNAGVELTMHGIPDEVADTIQKLQRK